MAPLRGARHPLRCRGKFGVQQLVLMLPLGIVPMTAAPGGDLDAGDAWDAVVIGTGMGGAAIGHRLTQSGFRVLFLERGRDSFVDLDEARADDPDVRLAAGHWPKRIAFEIDGRRSEAFVPLGCGVGGSTNLYAAALERFERSDIESTETMTHPAAGWPVPWSEWKHWYAEAERLLQVRTGDGGADSGTTLPLASAVDEALAAHLRRNGLSPYRLHVGIGYQPGCSECGGRKCPRRCKSDAQTMFVDKALAAGCAAVLTESEVIRIEAGAGHADAVLYRRHGVEHRARARIVVLAAGAYNTPAILLRSSGPHWPNGLANRYDLVGRHLMFHANEWIAVWPPRGLSASGPRKTIGYRDFYTDRGRRLGSVQSTGLSASFGNIWHFVRQRLSFSVLRHVPLMAFVLKSASWAATRMFGSASIFVMLVEDIGYARNRVVLHPDDPARIQVHYTISRELRDRTRLARTLLKRGFRGLRTLSLQNNVELNYGHACGTCRFGHDPRTSVLDPDCRAHGVDNLYVVDASFMPSSGGANPALTIAANALRVGDIAVRRLELDDATQLATADNGYG